MITIIRDGEEYQNFPVNRFRGVVGKISERRSTVTQFPR